MSTSFPAHVPEQQGEVAAQLLNVIDSNVESAAAHQVQDESKVTAVVAGFIGHEESVNGSSGSATGALQSLGGQDDIVSAGASDRDEISTGGGHGEGVGQQIAADSIDHSVGEFATFSRVRHHPGGTKGP